MSNVKKLLPPPNDNPCLILDGGFSTELERSYHCDLSTSDLWSAVLLNSEKGCECIKNVHLDFLRAGADVIGTSSYQATVAGFVRAGHTVEDSERLMCKSVQLACEARDVVRSEHASDGTHRRPPYVALSLGCYGAALADGSEFTGIYPPGTTEESLYAYHRDRLAVYRRGGVLGAETTEGEKGYRCDVVAFETTPCAMEARAIARLMREEVEEKKEDGVVVVRPPFWVSFTGASDGRSCSSGDAVADCFSPFVIHPTTGAVDPVPGLLALGFNCTDPDRIPALLAAGADYLNGVSESVAATVSLVVYPNLGEVWDPVARDWKKESGMTADTFGPSVGKYVRDGVGSSSSKTGARVGLIGGCCRSTPEMIAGLKKFINE